MFKCKFSLCNLKLFFPAVLYWQSSAVQLYIIPVWATVLCVFTSNKTWSHKHRNRISLHQNEAEDVPLSPGAESQYYRLDKCILSLYVFLSGDESDSLYSLMCNHNLQIHNWKLTALFRACRTYGLIGRALSWLWNHIHGKRAPQKYRFLFAKKDYHYKVISPRPFADQICKEAFDPIP